VGRSDGAKVWTRVLSELADVPVTVEWERPSWWVRWCDGPTLGVLMERAGICQVKWDTSVQFIWGWTSGWLIQAWVGMAGGRGRRPNRAGLAW